MDYKEVLSPLTIVAFSMLAVSCQQASFAVACPGNPAHYRGCSCAAALQLHTRVWILGYDPSNKPLDSEGLKIHEGLLCRFLKVIALALALKGPSVFVLI